MPHPLPHQKEHTLPELLAPAGSPRAFRAAMAAGADAVYLSGKRFGARSYAQNFTDEEIADAVVTAHTWDVKVYVTVNTLIHDRELAAVGEYLLWLYSIGVDAVLVQDLGVAALARSIVPGLPLHASTQMTIHTADGVRIAADQGFSRVVLARELSLDEVQGIGRETADLGIGLEVFVHGALCYCYSGQCLLSSVIGGRSGNRGMCAQPCRKPYTMVTGVPDAYGRPVKLQESPLPDRYLLSPKDLCTYPYLDRLVQSPVISLKIEGRMKSPEYVATVVSIYRRALDGIASGTWTLQDSDMQDLAVAFNREFTRGYLFGERHNALMGRKQPDNRGLLIGTVTGYDTRSGDVTIRPSVQRELSAGDGLLFRNPHHEGNEAGFQLNAKPSQENGMIRLTAPFPVRRGDEVCLTSSTGLTGRAHRIIWAPLSLVRRPLQIDLSVRISNGGIPFLEGVIDAGRGHHVPVTCTSGVRFLPAKTRPLTAEQVMAGLKKTGGTPFAIRTISMEYDEKMFVPVAELNRMRREFLALAENELVTALRPADESVGRAKKRWAAIAPGINTPPMTPPGPRMENLKIAVYADRIDVVKAAVSAGCDRVYFEAGLSAGAYPSRMNAHVEFDDTQLLDALAACTGAGIPLVWKLPRIIKAPELEFILSVLLGLHKDGLSACMVESTGTARAIGSALPGMHIYGSTGLNIFNHVTVRNLANQFFLLTISPELSGAGVEDLVRLARTEQCDTGLELIVQGSAEAMVSEDCLLQLLSECNEGKQKGCSSRGFFGIRDSTGRVFPVRTDGLCRTHIFNAAETCLLDYIPFLLQAGIDSVAIDARGRTKAYAREMVHIYRDAIIKARQDTTGTRHDLTSLKKRVKEIALGGITAGHFERGLKSHET